MGIRLARANLKVCSTQTSAYINITVQPSSGNTQH